MLHGNKVSYIMCLNLRNKLLKDCFQEFPISQNVNESVNRKRSNFPEGKKS